MRWFVVAILAIGTVAVLAVGAAFGVDAVARRPGAEQPFVAPAASLGRLAYVEDGDIWLKDVPDGTPHRLTNDGRNAPPRWSASGQWLAFRKVVGSSGPVEVWVVRADGSSSSRLNQRDANIGWFEWAPHRDHIAFVSAAGTSYGALEVVDAGGSNRRELAPSGVGRIAWSPDGAWIAFDQMEVTRQGTPPTNRRAALQMIRPDGSGRQELLNAGDPSPYEILLAGWSGDGQHIIYWTDLGWSASLLADGAPLFTLTVTGGQSHKLSDAILYHNDFWAAAPATRELAFTDGRGRETWSRKRIAVADSDTGTVSYLTASDVAAFSPFGLRTADTSPSAPVRTSDS